jgi:predicted SprT family Zn-dependent metalloprotease
MNLNDAEFLARTLIHKHVPHYRFGWMFRKRANGMCNYKERTIYLSKPLTELRTEKAVYHTIMHEIAHALTQGAKHGPVWQAQMRKFGLPTQRCSQDAVDVSSISNWRAVCKGCGTVVHRLRKPRTNWSCAKCSPSGYSTLHQLTFTRI